MVILSNQGQQNKDQTRAQIEKQDHKNEVELGSEFQIGNSGSQSQKKSGRQAKKDHRTKFVGFRREKCFLPSI